MKEKQREEAIARLSKIPNLHPDVLNSFKKDGTVFYSEQTRLGGILYWISNNEDFVELVKNFEEEYHALVYHAILNFTEFGQMLSLFYVSEHEDEWEFDRIDLDYGTPLVYVINLDAPFCSEFGRIGFAIQGGGLIRTA